MKNRHLSIIIFSTGIIIALIIFFQLSWLQKVFSYEEKEFNGRVVNVINAFQQQNNLANGTLQTLSKFIERADENTYLLKVSRFPSTDSLKRSLHQLLEQEEVFIDCRLANYDASTGKYRYKAYLKGSGSLIAHHNLSEFRVFDRNHDYIYINFPNRGLYILHRLDNWILSTVLLIGALLTLLVLLINFLRQRYVIRFQRDFVNNIVHEFKTPLAVMKIASEVLNKEKIAENPGRLNKYAAIISSQTRHLEQQVHRILQMMSTEDHRIQLDRKEISSRDLINQAVTKLEPLLEDKGGKISIDIDPAGLYFVGDQVHLELALVNILENAIKYSRDPVIQVNVTKKEGMLSLSIRDNGIGIDKKYVSLVFNKFYRVPSGDIHDVKGFGLGLNFVKKVVDAHKGKILVNSKPGTGTVFNILIPQ